MDAIPGNRKERTRRNEKFFKKLVLKKNQEYRKGILMLNKPRII